MTTALPRSSRPSLTPPTAALPPLPVGKTRRSAGSSVPTPVAASHLPVAPSNRSVSMNPHSSGSSLPTATISQSSSVTSLPTLNNNSTRATRSSAAPEGRTLRRTISAAAFPQPPKVGTGASGLSSPLSGGASKKNLAGRKSSSEATSPMTPAGQSRLKRPKTVTGNTTGSLRGTSVPSFLNGSGDSKSIANEAGTRRSDGLLSLSSPPHSRSSSAQGSCSTSATTFDDSSDGAPRGREGADNKSGSSGSKEGKGNVLVSVRVRPDAGGDNGRSEGEWMVDGRKSLVAYRGKEGGDYYYDNVFATHDNNRKVYDASAKRLVRRVMEGYHGTVFAYGMTGTGKTFSMQGTTSSPGVIPLAITDIFSYIRETPHREFLLRVSYLEIYNERIHDLLSTPASATMGGPGASQPEEIKLREDAKRGVYASPLKEEIVQSPTQLLRVIARGDHSRRTSSTQYNARSSRSHAVVQIVVESRERMPGTPGTGSLQDNKRSALLPGGVRVSTLSLIDLAGSERAAESKERRQEGAHINKSLLTLGTVIARLSGDKDKNGQPTDKDGKHLPYRDSKLTRLLQPALSGNSLVSILCTIQTGSAGSPAIASSHTGETLNTLKFASRAKNNIVSHAKKAEEALGSGTGDAGSRVLLERYRMEILDLRTQLEGQVKGKAEEEEKEKEKEAEQRHEEQMLEMQLARTALKERIEHLNRLILCSKSTGVNSSSGQATLGNDLSGDSKRNPSAMSARSSATASLAENGSGISGRTPSAGSASTIGLLSGNARSQSPAENGFEEDDYRGEFGDGTASLTAQNRSLQADLADKNRYIQTLEKRLLQARRSSHSRTSIGFSPQKVHGVFWEEGGIDPLIKEKDAEIADLRAKLDDKDRMVTALRSAARKRDMANLASGPASDHSPHSPTSSGLPSPGGKYANKDATEMNRLLDEMIQGRGNDVTPTVKRKPGRLHLGDLTRDVVPERLEVTEFPNPPSLAPIRIEENVI